MGLGDFEGFRRVTARPIMADGRNGFERLNLGLRPLQVSHSQNLLNVFPECG